MKKKIIAFGLMLVMLISALPFSASAAWDGTTKGSVSAKYSGGSGAKTDPFLIKNEADLAMLAADVNTGVYDTAGKYYKVVNPIDLGGREWTPIGQKVPFNGNFLCMKNKISGLKITESPSGAVFTGLFGWIGEKGAVLHVNIDDADLTSYEPKEFTADKWTSGSKERAFAGLIAGKNEGLVADCRVTGKISGRSGTAAQEIYIGGLVGFNDGGTITKGQSLAAVTGKENNITGGLVGGMSSGLLQSSNSIGNVTAMNTAGGLVGRASNQSGTICNQGLDIIDCFTMGELKTSGTAGGLVGAAINGMKNQKLQILSSYAKNNITVTGEALYAGGLIGYGEANNSQKSTLTIDQCYAEGNITADNVKYITDADAFGFFGGFAGAVNGDILNSYATGNLKDARESDNTQSQNRMVAGFAGKAVSVQNSFATCGIEASCLASGFIGDATGIHIVNCYSSVLLPDTVQGKSASFIYTLGLKVLADDFSGSSNTYAQDDGWPGVGVYQAENNDNASINKKLEGLLTNMKLYYMKKQEFCDQQNEATGKIEKACKWDWRADRNNGVPFLIFAEPPVQDVDIPNFNAEQPVTGFTDINGHWAKTSIEWVYTKGLFTGTGPTLFAPENKMDRGMLAVVLWRLDGKPNVTDSAGFKDISSDAYYKDAVNWAAKNKIVNGTSATTYAPTTFISREQLATMLYRYAEYAEIDLSKKADLSKYTDQGKISTWAKDAMSWAVGSEIINGKTATTLDPAGFATRAEVAAMLERFSKLGKTA